MGNSFTSLVLVDPRGRRKVVLVKTLGEPETDLVLGRLDGVGTVADVLWRRSAARRERERERSREREGERARIGRINARRKRDRSVAGLKLGKREFFLFDSFCCYGYGLASLGLQGNTCRLGICLFFFTFHFVLLLRLPLFSETRAKSGEEEKANTEDEEAEAETDPEAE